MDGGQGGVMASLQGRLSWWMSIILLLVAAFGGMLAYWNALNEAHEWQDETLRQIARLVTAPPLTSTWSEHSAASEAENDEVPRIYLFRLSPQGVSTDEAGTPLVIPGDQPDGLCSLGAFRVLVHSLPHAQRIAIVQSSVGRDEIARDSALRTLLPLLFLLPLLLAALAYVIRSILYPLRRLTQGVDLLREQDVHALQSQALPTEIRPFVVAINELLQRMASSVAAQRRFVADAAHELRSPLTALSLQAGRIDMAQLPIAQQEKFIAMRNGIMRSRHLLEQLLSFSKVQATHQPPYTLVSLLQIYRSVLEDLMPLAEDKQLNVEVESSGEVLIPAYRENVLSIVKNLTDNAMRYTPIGGRVNLFLSESAQEVLLEVEDNGPGIPPNERVKVLAAFYRILGSGETGAGLGLSIVNTIVTDLGGRIELCDAEQSASGLRVKVWLPKRLPSPVVSIT